VITTVSDDISVIHPPTWDTPFTIYLIVAGSALLVFVNVSVIVNVMPAPLPVPADPVIVPLSTVDVQVKLLATVAVVVMLTCVPLQIVVLTAVEIISGIGLTVITTVATD
jgi:hypothetical protein